MNYKSEINELIKRFYDYYAAKGYRLFDNQPLLVENDPTLLFVNSTIAPFKHGMMNGEEIPNTAQIQDCFRSNSTVESLIPLFFRMIGHVSMRGSLRKIMDDLIEFFNQVCGIATIQLYGVIHQSDKELQDAWTWSALKENMVLINGDTRKYSTRWKYGDGFGLSGRGMTIVFRSEQLNACSEQCDPHCNCGKYVGLGNVIVVKSEQGDKEYIDTGFGLERLIACKYFNDPFKIPEHQIQLRKLNEIGFNNDGAKKVFNLMRGIFKLIEQGVVPYNKKESYVLKAIIRKLIIELSVFMNKDFSKVEAMYERVFDLLKGEEPLLTAVSNEIVIEEVRRYLSLMNKRVADAKRFIRKNSKLDKSLLKEQVTQTFGLPYFVTEDLLVST